MDNQVSAVWRNCVNTTASSFGEVIPSTSVGLAFKIYAAFERQGVTVRLLLALRARAHELVRFNLQGIVSASLVSLVAIVAMILVRCAQRFWAVNRSLTFGAQFGKPRKAYPRTHVTAYFICLLVANTIQATATALSLRWIAKGQIDQDMFCQAQGTSLIRVHSMPASGSQARSSKRAIWPWRCGKASPFCPSRDEPGMLTLCSRFS